MEVLSRGCRWRFCQGGVVGGFVKGCSWRFWLVPSVCRWTFLASIKGVQLEVFGEQNLQSASDVVPVYYQVHTFTHPCSDYVFVLQIPAS